MANSDTDDDAPSSPSAAYKSLRRRRTRKLRLQFVVNALAAARLRLPMVELDGTVEVTGVDGPVPLIDLFQARDNAHRH
jgi:predicted dithiol-disulfide oxidoreductase (DUF899 family)